MPNKPSIESGIMADELDEMTSAERLAYLYQECGPEAVALVLQTLVDPTSAPPEMAKYLEETDRYDCFKNYRGTSRESLERDAVELQGMGLPVGDLVAAAALEARPEREVDCRYQGKTYDGGNGRWFPYCRCDQCRESRGED